MVLPSQRHSKHQSTFRDEELFDEETDIKYYQGPEKYDTDDVPVAENLWLKGFRNEERYYNSGFDTNIDHKQYAFIEAIHSPWITEKSRLKQEKINTTLKIIELQLINDKDIKPQMIREMYKSSTILTNGKMTVNHVLCNTAANLLLNSKQWGETEKAIMDEIRIPIYKKVYGNYSLTKCRAVRACLACDYTNKQALEYLKEYYPSYVLNLGSIVT